MGASDPPNSLFISLLVLAALLPAAACGGEQVASGGSPPRPGAAACQNGARATVSSPNPVPPPAIPPTVIDAARSYCAVIHSSRGDFSLQLEPRVAPVTVNNFVYLAQHHFYDGLTFHRVVTGFVVQGGDPKGDGTGGPPYKLPDESNPSQWPKGTVGMASGAGGVSGSQFFITLGDAPHLASGGVYNHFGSVASGQDVVARVQVGDTTESIDIQAS